MKRHLVVTVLAFLGGMAQSQPNTVVSLQCSGQIETALDRVVTREATKVLVTVNTTKSTAKLAGWWGCVDILETSGCFAESVPVTISAEEVKYFETSKSDGFSHNNSFTINRYTGTFSIFSISSAPVRPGVTWRVSINSGTLFCEPAKRLF